MACHEFFFKFFDPFGSPIAEYENVLSVDLARSENTVGIMQMRLAGCDIDDLGILLRPDLRCEVWHKPPGGNLRLDGDTVWLLRKWVHSWDRNSRETELYFYDAMHLITRRIVAWYATENPQSPSHMGGDGAVGAGNDTRLMLWRVMQYNFGEWVDNYTGDPNVTVPGVIPPAAGGPGTALPFTSIRRQMDLLDTMAPWGTSGVGSTHEMAWANCLDVLQQIGEDTEAQGVPLIFDVVYDPTTQGLRFQTWANLRGSDRSTSQVFSPDNQNVYNFQEVHDWENTAEWAYVGGADDGTGQRLVVGVVDQSRQFLTPYGMAEVFVDGGDLTDQAAMEAEGRAALWRYRPKVLFTGSAQDTAQSVFGRDYFYGDRVGVSGTIDATARIRRYGITIRNNQSEIDIPLDSDDNVMDIISSR